MADNLGYTPGAGATVATDDDGTAHHQYVKIEFGGDGTFTKVSTTDPLPVTGDELQTNDAAFVSGPLAVIGGVRRDADTTPVSADNDVQPFVFDEAGRLKTSTYPASIASYTDNITVNGDTVSLDVSRYSNLMIHCKGTFSTVNCTFEGSIDGGTTWFAVQGVRTNANTIELTTGNMSAAPAYAWELSVNALTNFRVRATAYTSGTQVWVFQAGIYATEPIPAAQVSATQPVSGTVTATPSGIQLGVAEDAAISGNAMRIGMKASNAIHTAMSADNDMVSPATDRRGQQFVLPGRASTATLTSVADAATSATILAANTSRMGAIIHNNSTAILYIKFGATASATSYTYRLEPNATWEMAAPVYTGIIDGIWSANASGSAYITEQTS
jgi:hypothetical protein